MTLKTHTRHRRIVVFCAALCLVGLTNSAFAGNTWTGGGGSNNWSDNNNWGGAQPGYGTLTFSGSTRTTNSDDNITAMNILDWTGTSPWTLNQGGSTVLSLFDNGGGQAKVQNDSTGLVTINLPITFAAFNGSPPNPFGEINAVSGDITFGTGTLTVNGSSVNGIKMFGSGHTTTFNDTVSATGKWFGMTATNDIMAVGGAFTSGDIYVMNSGTLKLNSGGTITTSALRLGGDFGNTGNQNQALGGTLQFTNLAGGQSFASVINTVTGNTSGALLIDSQNTSNTNTISGNIFLDSNLRIQQATSGTLAITNATLDLKGNTLSLNTGATGNAALLGNINITGVIGNSTGSGQLVVGTNGVTNSGGTVTLSNANTYTGQTFVRNGTLAFTSAGSSNSSIIRFGSDTGTSVNANINLTTLTGGTTIGSVINPIATSGSGTLTINSQNTSNTNTFSAHFGLDRDLTINQSTGGALAFTNARVVGDTTTGFDIKTHTLTLGGGGNMTFSDVYNSTGSGVGNIVSNSTGTITLGGAIDNVSVGATVNSGTLVLGKTSSGTVHAIGSGLTVAGGTAQLGGSGGDQIFDSTFVTVTSGAFDTNGQSETFNTLSLAGTGISNAGALVNSSASGSSTITPTGGTTLTAAASIGVTNAAASLTLANNISGATFGITKVGAGTLTLSGVIGTTTGTLTANGGTLILSGSSANTYTGLTTVSAGELDLNKTSATAIAGNVLVNGGTLKWVTSATANQIANSASINMTSGAVSLNGATQTLNDFTNSGGTFTTGTGSLTGTGASMTWSGGSNTINAGGSVNDPHVTISGGTNTIESTGSLTINTGTGLVMSGGTLTLNAGTTATNGGKILLMGSSTNNIAASAGTTSSINSSNPTNAGLIDLANASKSIFTDTGATLNVSANITSSGSLTKTGTGTLNLTGANTYTGTTTVNAGKLFVNGSTSSSSAVGVNNSGTTLGGNGTIGGTITMNSSGTNLSPGASGVGSVGKLTVGALTMTAGNLNIDIISGGTTTGTGAGTVYDQVSFNPAGINATSINGATLVVSALASSLAVGDKYFIVDNASTNADAYGTFTNGSTVTDTSGDTFAINYADSDPNAGPLTANDISLTVLTVVPEPSTWAASALALAVIGYQFCVVRRRKAKSL